MTTYLPFALFGLWSLACVLLGAWMTHRKQIQAPPLPDFADAERMFNWIRTGKAEKPTDGAESPPVEGKDGVNFEL